ncbi:MAG: transporter [Rikenellaceae bacterium]
MTSKRIKQYALPVAMGIGTVGHQYISNIAFLSPYLISLILILTFTKLSPKHIRFSKSHFILLIIQIASAVAVYASLSHYNVTIAQGALMCVLIPTATTAPVATKILGGNVGYVTTYLFLCNCTMAILTPLIFTIISSEDVAFFATFGSIIKRIGTLLVAPLVLIWLIRFFMPKMHDKIETYSHLSFPIWAITLMIATSSTVSYVLAHPNLGVIKLSIMALLAIILSIVQLAIGRKIGQKHGNAIACGQSLGQKNTILAIWIAQTFLDPASSLIPAIYVISQNLINSYQIWLKENKTKGIIK